MTVDDDFGVRGQVPEFGNDVVGELRLACWANSVTSLREQQVTRFDERTLCLCRCDLRLEIVVLRYHRLVLLLRNTSRQQQRDERDGRCRGGPGGRRCLPCHNG